MSLWDTVDDQQIDINDKPIWTLPLKSAAASDDVRRWLMTELKKLRHEDRQRTEEIQRHYKLYKGVSTERLHRDSNRETEIERSSIQRKIVINHLHDLTEQIVSRVGKFKPAIAVLPNNDEHKDKQAAKLAKLLYDHIAREQNIDMKSIENLRYCKVAGEGYLFVEWDPECGGLHPEYLKLKQEAKEKGVEVKDLKRPIKDAKGQVMKDKAGNPLYFDKPIYNGDVKLKVVRPEMMFFQMKRDWRECQYCFKVDYKHVEEVRADYPKFKQDIHKYKDEYQDQYSRYFEMETNNQTMVVEFYHPPSDYLPEGAYIKFTPDVILETKDYPYDHGEWPFERLTDIDIPGEKHGRSWFINGRQIATQINNLTTMYLRNVKWLSSPKWMVPKGSIKLTQLHNNVGIAEYSGPVAPQIAAPNVISGELFKLRDDLKQDLQQIQGISGVGRGEPPPGIKSGVALKFLNEMENERMNSFYAKYNDWKRLVARKVLLVASQFYDESDERTVAVFGKHNEYSRVGFDVKALAGQFSIKVQNSNAIAESKAQQVQDIFDIREAFPTLMSDEQVAEMLDIGQSEKYLSEASAAVRAAEAENDMILDGETIEAEEYEYHIQHWREHVIELQKPGFRKLPKDIQEKLKSHILTHEMHMDNMVKKNPKYLEVLMVSLPQFPLFYTPDHLAPNPVPEPVLDPMMEPGAAEDQLRAEQIQAQAAQQADQIIEQETMGLAAPEI